MTSTFHSSASLLETIRVDHPIELLADVAMAVSAFGFLLFRYSRETSFTIVLAVGRREPCLIQLTPSAETEIDDVTAQIRESLGRFTDGFDRFDLELSLSWSELAPTSPSAAQDGALLSLAVELPEVSLNLERSAHRGLLETADPLASIARHWRTVVSALHNGVGSRVAEVPLLDSAEHHLLLSEWSRSEVRPDLSAPGLLHRIFEERARERPDAIALLCNDRGRTYAELDARAERLASGLVSRGIGPGSFVAFQLPRSFDVYTVILGVLKAGAAYVPLDPEYPSDRVQYILADCKVDAFVTLSSCLNEMEGGAPCPVILLDRSWDSVLPVSKHATRRAPTPQDTCYVIYTSGSTGKPKGVAIAHRSAVNLVRVEQSLFEIRRDDRVFQSFSIAFDAAVEEVWLAFAAGATLVAGTKEVILADLSRYLTDNQVTVFSTVPTLLATLEGDLPTVRILIVGGEACPQAIVRRWATPGRAMYNTYGPTEATVIATCARLSPDEPVTIGRPIANYSTYILDAAGQLAAAGASGELCIGGVGLARGYVGKPELTASRFVPNPYAHTRAAPPLLYRTGDRARFDAAGNIEFLGRLDDQVKLRGFRIELGEIEAQLMACAEVAQAIVIVREDTPGVQQLVAYVVLRDGDAAVPGLPGMEASSGRSSARSAQAEGGESEARLKERLRKQLPHYMVPASIEFLPVMPTLTSGKVNKKALPLPRRARARLSATSLAPGGPLLSPLEQKIARAWAKLFGLETVGRDADFFADLGGHSLLAAKMVSLLRRDPELEALSVLDVYKYTTVAALAKVYARPAGAAAMHAPVGWGARSAVRIAPPRSHVSYWVCGAVQLLGLYFLFGIYGLQLEAPYLAYGWLRHQDVGMVRALLATAAVLFALPPLTLLLAVALKWIIIGRYKAGRYPLWGAYYFRWWLVDRLLAIVPTTLLAGTPLLNAYYRLLGARIGSNVFLGSDSIGTFDLVSIDDETTILADANLSGHAVEDGMLILGPIRIGARCFVGARSVLTEDVALGDDASVGELSMLPRGSRVPSGERWVGSPARRVRRRAPFTGPIARPTAGKRALFAALYALAVLAMPVIVLTAILPALLTLNHLYRLWDGEYTYLLLSPLLAVAFVVILSLEIAAAKWLLLGRVAPGTHPVFGGFYFRKWLVDQAMDLSLNLTGALYATSFLTYWYRLLGVRLGKHCEVSTASAFVPDLLEVGDNAFIADCVCLGAPRVERGYLHMERTRIGERTFIGNSAVVPAGADVAADCLIGCLSACPAEEVGARSGSSWFGSPATLLPRRDVRSDVPAEMTYAPPPKLVAQRLAIELLRITLPTTGFLVSTCILIMASIRIRERTSLLIALAAFPLVYAALGAAAALFVVLLKWVLIGRYRPGETPLWSSFVWRTEFVTGMHENLANPFFVERLGGTPYAAWFFRALGMKVGKRVYMATTEFTEYDLLEIGDDVCLNNDCTLQTHLFEDRVMKMSSVRIGDRCNVGGDSIVLYDTYMEEGSSLGPLSLLMKGETLPAGSRWEGSPAGAVGAGANASEGDSRDARQWQEKDR